MALTLFYVVPRLGLNFWKPANHACKDNDAQCGLGIHVVGTGIVAALGVMFFLRRELWTVSKWRRRTAKETEKLFPWLPPQRGPTGVGGGPRRPGRPADRLVPGIVSRDRLVKNIAEDLDEGSEPLVIVGRTGSGKTMVLVKLAERLARQNQVPIAINLRDEENLDFLDLAEKAYLRNPLSRGQTTQHWEWIVRHLSLVTFLCDELDKAKGTVQKKMDALDAAAAQGLRLVAACRPEGVPADRRRGRIDLEPLDRAIVIDRLCDRLARARKERKVPPEVKEDVAALVDQAAITGTPYYLSLARALADVDQLPVPEPDCDARVLLLDGYRSALEDGAILPDAGLPRGTRERTLIELEKVAFFRLLGNKDTRTIELKADEAGLRTNAGEVVARAKRLGVLAPRSDEHVRFGHPTTMAYFASCLLRNGRSNQLLWEMAMNEQLTTNLGLALTLANAGARDPDLAVSTSGELLHKADAEEITAPQRLSLAATAAEVLASAGPSNAHATAGQIVERAEKVTGNEPALAPIRRRLIGALTKLDDPAVYSLLWSLAAEDKNYLVQREAARALVDAGPTAVERVLPTLIDQIKNNEGAANGEGPRSDDDRDGPSGQLKAIAWVLPCLRTAAADSPALLARLDDAQRQIIGLTNAKRARQRGLEASIAQGFKLDASRQMDPDPDPIALKMLNDKTRDGSFWFTRVLLLQALALRYVKPGQRAARLPEQIRAARKDPHPFVRQVAGLCARAIREGKPERYIWIDLNYVIAGTPHTLTAEATQLLGDIVLALNLNEQGTDADRLKFGKASVLPACLSRSRDRREILGSASAPAKCPFKNKDGPCLCPYEYENPEASRSRRELSRAFCRHQRRTAQRLPWHPTISTKALKHFWAEMEDLVQF